MKRQNEWTERNKHMDECNKMIKQMNKLESMNSRTNTTQLPQFTHQPESPCLRLDSNRGPLTRHVGRAVGGHALASLPVGHGGHLHGGRTDGLEALLLFGALTSVTVWLLLSGQVTGQVRG